MNQSKPLVGVILIAVGSILIYMGWKGLSIATNYLSSVKAALP
jgi:hypothetical protein